MSKKEVVINPIVDRRQALSLLAGFVSGIFFIGFSNDAFGQRGVIRRTHRRIRRRVRRRIRRRVTYRIVAGHWIWLAPVALTVGWELVLDNNRVVVVKEIKVIERSGTKVEVAVVQGADGKIEELEIARENTAENSKDLQGSLLPDEDKTTPAIEMEEDSDMGK
ncbi:MAG: hypothetical protein AB1585_14710 [Thermodesulfobacteriota bacterium]